MTVKERILHAVLFEAGAILLSAVLMAGFADTGSSKALGIGILISLAALAWNIVFNFVFDQIFTAPRISRGVMLRVFHTALFEGGLLLATVPLLAYFLSLNLWQALGADIALTAAVSVYAFLFNWLYDHCREKWLKS
ncbi:MAG: PACE efflux transporter [Neisseria sp.]|nr:PACE efflux transporter [Neisseria sp.]